VSFISDNNNKVYI